MTVNSPSAPSALPGRSRHTSNAFGNEILTGNAGVLIQNFEDRFDEDFGK
jgi:hypothetical protein